MTPTVARIVAAVVANWHRFHVSLWVWAAFFVFFLAIEMPPVFWPGCPWETLSNTSWDAQSAWHPARVIFGVFLLVLSIHILARIPAAFLITVVVGGAVALGLHLLLARVFHVHPAWLGLHAPATTYVKAALR